MSEKTLVPPAVVEHAIKKSRQNLFECSDAHLSVLNTFDKMVKNWTLEYQKTQGKFAVELILKGVDFAALKHKGQMRKHAHTVPYIVHPLRVAALLWDEGGIRIEELILAALLHDTLEDTETSSEEIASLFGEEVLALVEELTEDFGLNPEEEKAFAEAMSEDAKIIKLADRTHNLRDLLDHPPEVWREDKINNFLTRSRNLLKALKGVHLRLEQLYRNAIKSLEKRAEKN